ncbi:hypothetical protein PbJCM13498_37650 [Prolixibacter bellariivorans]|uniref:Uncharacterized protein n=1 Tax=Prolixibacter bellariivorans TaxID=314319 RepID=A0A5M4B428_9BACT|nr:DUF6544 family protein [Prolixibacter bellariivorans]GET34902.1 hypothetical protein PbJCM13498_37650 [Prolixibacter bellariivorans]
MSIVLMIVAGIVVLSLLVIIIGSLVFKGKISLEVKRLMSAGKGIVPGVIRDDKLEGLPEPVQRYLRYAGVEDKRELLRLRISQKGEIRTDREQKWMPFRAEQFVSTAKPGFLWRANTFPVLVRDMFDGKRGSMRINFLGLRNLAVAETREVDQGSLMRYLAEMVWYPTAFLRDEITWHPMDENSAMATIIAGDSTAEGVFHFNAAGEVEMFTAKRYREIHGHFELDKWVAHLEEYREAEGFKIPFKGTISWKLPEGDLDYFRFELTGYNRIT